MPCPLANHLPAQQEAFPDCLNTMQWVQSRSALSMASVPVSFFFTAKLKLPFLISHFIYLFFLFCCSSMRPHWRCLAKTISCLVTKYQACMMGKMGNQKPNLKSITDIVSIGNCPAHSHIPCLERQTIMQHDNTVNGVMHVFLVYPCMQLPFSAPYQLSIMAKKIGKRKIRHSNEVKTPGVHH